jgi:hypothetical protein
LADQLIDLGRQGRTGQHMVAIRVDGDLSASYDHVEHNLVGSWVPREDCLKLLR